MFRSLITSLFGSANDRRLRGYQSRVDAINALEPELARLSDEALRVRTAEFRRQLVKAGTLRDILVPAFATVREAAKRTLGQRHFDVQLIGGMSLHEGKIAEMKAGEGKALAATLAVYLNALAGKGVHVVTVNDYLARRDAAWMGEIYSFLGLTTGVIVHGLDDAERKTAYSCDITYGTHSEYGFDYLRDNMKYRLEDMVQRGHFYAIVNEVDSILIDEARTPLTITLPPENQALASITLQNYFRIYEKLAGMTGTAATEADELFDIYKLEVVEIPTNLTLARLDENDAVYRTQKEKYAAILAEVERANVRFQPVLVGTASIEKSEVLADYLKAHGYKQIDFGNQNEIERLYDAARTGKPAKLFAVSNPPHEQEPYILAAAGLPGAITIVTNMAARGIDIKLGGSLEMRIMRETAGTTDAAKFERIKAEVERFREIVYKAEEVVEVEPAKGSKPAKPRRMPSGLYIIGFEHYESRRLDNQLRWRSGIGGDPGRSKFFVSLEDDLMRVVGSDRFDTILTRLGLKEGEAIVHPWIKTQLEKAQQKVEAHNAEIRKRLFHFNEIQNEQRKLIFSQRIELMKDENVAGVVADMRRAFVEDVVTRHVPEHAYAEQWDLAGLKEELKRALAIDLPVDQWRGIAYGELLSRIERRADEKMLDKVAQWGADVMRYVEKTILLQTIDHLWRKHVEILDRLPREDGLHSGSQHDALQEHRSKAFNLFEDMTVHLREAVTAQLMRVEIVPSEDKISEPVPAEIQRAEPSRVDGDSKKPAIFGRVGRNENCPCGSGKKYKYCHGRLS
jgi:preprotein translocase subunit SecA